MMHQMHGAREEPGGQTQGLFFCVFFVGLKFIVVVLKVFEGYFL